MWLAPVASTTMMTTSMTFRTWPMTLPRGTYKRAGRIHPWWTKKSRNYHFFILFSAKRLCYCTLPYLLSRVWSKEELLSWNRECAQTNWVELQECATVLRNSRISREILLALQNSYEGRFSCIIYCLNALPQVQLYQDKKNLGDEERNDTSASLKGLLGESEKTDLQAAVNENPSISEYSHVIRSWERKLERKLLEVELLIGLEQFVEARK